MNEEPQTDDKGRDSTAKHDEGPTPSHRLTHSSPTPARQSQTDNPSDEANPTKNKMRLLIAIQEWVGRGFRFLDDHAGSITAIATLLIAGLTYGYVHYSRAQWTTMKDQLTEMKTSSDLAKAVAKMDKGQPTMWVSDDEIFHQGTNRVWAVMAISNKGRTYADHISVAVMARISTTEPPRPRKFASADFHDASPNRLDPSPESDPIQALVRGGGMIEATGQVTKDSSIYVGGQIQYQDFTGDPSRIDFCQFFPTGHALGPPNQPNEGYRSKVPGEPGDCN